MASHEHQGTHFYAGLASTSLFYVGSDDTVFNYGSTTAEIQAAIDAAGAGDVIYFEPGTYTLTDTVDIAESITLCAMGAPESVIFTSANDLAKPLFDINVPATGSATIIVKFVGIKMVLADTDESCIDIDNDGGATQDLEVHFYDSSILLTASANTGVAIDCDHNEATKTISLYFFGNGKAGIQCLDMEFKNAGDVINARGYTFYKSDSRMGINTSADDLAAGIDLGWCAGAHENFTDGGHASQTVKVFFCITYDTDALVDTNDLTGAHTETIVA